MPPNRVEVIEANLGGDKSPSPDDDGEQQEQARDQHEGKSTVWVMGRARGNCQTISG